jgi:hypothetical protein
MASWITDMFGGLFDKGDSTDFAEFKTGADRQKRKPLEKRWLFDNSAYRTAMPAPIAGSAPGIDEQHKKTPTTWSNAMDTDNGQGVNFFGYGNTTNQNRFSTDGVKIDTNKNATGQVKISGFRTFKKPMSESDYGLGDTSAASDGSFYRNNLETDRYGAMYATNIIGPKGGGTNVVSYTTLGAEIAFGRESKKVQDKIAQVNAGDPKRTNNDPTITGNNKDTLTSGYSDSNPDPLAQVPRRLPSGETEKDLFLKKYLTDKHQIIYKPRGELPQGGSLPNSANPVDGKFLRFSESFETLSNASQNSTGESDQGQRSSLFSSIYQDGDGKELKDISNDHSHLIVSDRSYKKTLFNRRKFVYDPPSVTFDVNQAKIDETRYRRAETLSGGQDFSVEAQSDQAFVTDGTNANIDRRIDSRYHNKGKLPESDERFKGTQLHPKNTIVDRLGIKNVKEDANDDANIELARHRDSTTKYDETYTTSLKNLGADSDNKSIKNIKNYNLLSKLAEDGLVTPGKRSIGSDPKSGELTYEQLFKDNPFKLGKKRVPNYSLPGSVEVGNDNPRADAFNLKGVLDAADATNDGSMPEWAKDDFIPLYFHDLVNKKYVPFRSFINSLSDQSDAEWTNTRYLGRADEVSVYNGFTRTMSIDFNVVAFSIEELLPMWQRINYMTGLTKPAKYTDNGFIIPPLVKFNLGDIYRNQPVTITSVSTTIPQEATWELLNADKEYGSYKKNQYMFANGVIKKEGVKVARYPTMCTLNVSMKVLEKQTPETIQNHFGTLVKNSNDETKPAEFNKNLSKV